MPLIIYSQMFFCIHILRVYNFILLAIIGLLVAVIWFFGQRLNILWSQNQHPLNADVRLAIQNANISLYQDGIADPVAKRVYFPGLGVYVPLSDKSQKLVYTFTQADTTAPAEAIFNSKPTLYSFLSTWEDVPCIQRVAGASVDKPSQLTWQGSPVAATVKLSDGRSLLFYKNAAKNCDKFWAEISPSDIVQILKQAQPY